MSSTMVDAPAQSTLASHGTKVPRFELTQEASRFVALLRRVSGDITAAERGVPSYKPEFARMVGEARSIGGHLRSRLGEVHARRSTNPSDEPAYHPVDRYYYSTSERALGVMDRETRRDAVNHAYAAILKGPSINAIKEAVWELEVMETELKADGSISINDGRLERLGRNADTIASSARAAAKRLAEAGLVPRA